MHSILCSPMILIVRSDFDKSGDDVVKTLETGVIDTLIKHDTASEVVHVPGAVEIPVIIQHFLRNNPGKFSAAIALGCVIKGDTDHYELVTKSVTEGLTRVALDTGIPVIQGVLACQNQQQATERKHLGKEYAETALTMKELLK